MDTRFLPSSFYQQLANSGFVEKPRFPCRCAALMPDPPRIIVRSSSAEVELKALARFLPYAL